MGQLQSNYLKHYLGGGKAALDFRPDRIRALVAMATDSSHRFLIGKILLAFFFFLAGKEQKLDFSDGFEIRPDLTADCAL